MRRSWALAILAGMLLVLGCQTQRPNLKPPEGPEALNLPTAEERFNVAAYPKEAMHNREGLKKFNQSQDVVPVRGPSPMGGMGGAGQMRPY